MNLKCSRISHFFLAFCNVQNWITLGVTIKKEMSKKIENGFGGGQRFCGI